MPYDSADWIALLFDGPSAISVPINSSFRNINDLLNAARAAPGTIRLSHSGVGGTWHAVNLTLEANTGVRFAQIPYNGGIESATAAAGGHVDAATSGATEAFPMVQSGHLRFLGISGEQPDPMFPGVPTFAEQGIDGMWGTFGAVAAPRGIPLAARATIESAIIKVTSTDEWKDFVVNTLQGTVNFKVGEELHAFLADLDRIFEQMF